MKKQAAETFVAELQSMLGDYVKESGYVFYSSYIGRLNTTRLQKESGNLT